jgi:UDP-glucose 4-epimerase
VRAGKPITITDPNMTRFVMTLAEAVDLVLYAFSHGENGDMFVQKAPAATIETLARSTLEVIGEPDHETRIIGTRHGEKLYETLLSREEMAVAQDLGNYYRVPADNRDLNYSVFVEKGEKAISTFEDFNSHNTRQLGQAEMSGILRQLDYFKDIAAGQSDTGKQ